MHRNQLLQSQQQQDVFQSLGTTISDYHDLTEIGSGKDCVIYKAKCRKMPSYRYVVVKAYNKATITKVKARSIRREARMMQTINRHRIPNMVGFFGAFQDSKSMYIVMECCESGDLLEKLLSEGRAMAEKRVVNEVALPLLESLTYLHKLDLIHRDIKLENIFVDGNGCVKFGDLGLTMSKREERGISPVGTVEYMAPELCKLPPAEMIMSGRIHPNDIKPIDEKVDIWALGVTLYELVTGRSPFDGGSKPALKQNIVKMKVKRVPRFLSDECSDFIHKMLTYEASQRPSAATLLQHPWIQTHTDRVPLAPPLPKRMASERKKPETGDLRQSSRDTQNQPPKSASILKPASQIQTHKHNRSEPQSHDSHGSAIKARHASDGSPAPPLISPDSIVLVTPKRKEKFGSKLSRLLPTYTSKKELCMRGLWNFQISESESEEEYSSEES